MQTAGKGKSAEDALHLNAGNLVAPLRALRLSHICVVLRRATFLRYNICGGLSVPFMLRAAGSYAGFLNVIFVPKEALERMI